MFNDFQLDSQNLSHQSFKIISVCCRYMVKDKDHLSEELISIIFWVYICDWACENRAYLRKLHMFRKWYLSWYLLTLFQFCKLFLLCYGFVNTAGRFLCHSSCTLENIVSWSSKIRPNFVCRYALFLQARSHFMLYGVAIPCVCMNSCINVKLSFLLFARF